uniref:Putative secreted mucin n=1 Tax=Psorophora albipes TaxID=869069 RepID=T1D535_9DIPT
MKSIKLCVLIAFISALLPSTLGLPIFWFPWNYFYPTTSTSSSSSSSSTSTATTLRPINATLSIGNRQNTSAMIDMGTVIDGLTITRGKRSAGDERTSESFIQIGNQIIRLPPGDVSNLTINIIDGVPLVNGNFQQPQTSTPQVEGNALSGVVNRFRSFFADLLNERQQ